MTGLNNLFNNPEQRSAVTRTQRLNHLVEKRGWGESEQRDRVIVLEYAASRASDELVEHGQGVADRAATGTHHER
jgi:hypothetical protein